MTASKQLQDLLESTHYAGEGWDSLDSPPQQADGREGWDTEESAADPDDGGDEDSGPLDNLEKSYFSKGGKRGTCKPGQTAEETGCVPADGGPAGSPKQDLPPADAPGSQPTTPVYSRPARTASDVHGKVPTRDGQPVPLEKKTLYHVTTAAAAQEILKNGFDLSKVKPRWRNDYAVSTAPSAKAAVRFFTRRGATSMIGDRVLLKLTVQGRGFDLEKDETPHSSDARSYTSGLVSRGYDANFKLGYVYNPKAISRIEMAPTPSVRGKSVSSGRVVQKESYFATCEHDPETGGCLPKGAHAGAGDEGTPAGTAPSEPALSQLSKIKATKEHAKAVAARLGYFVWSPLPDKVKAGLAKTWAGAKAVEHKAMTGFRKSRELAAQLAQEWGLGEKWAHRLGVVLGTLDLVASWGMVSAAGGAAVGGAVGGPLGAVAGAKVATWTPVFSLGFIATSSAANPFKTVAAARHLAAKAKGVVKRLFAKNDLYPYGLVRQLSVLPEDQRDWFMALLAAALDEERGDLGKALFRANQLLEQTPDGPDGDFGVFTLNDLPEGG